MRFCKDCKHIIVKDSDPTLHYARCAVFKTKNDDYPVNGIVEFGYAATARLGMKTVLGPCGPDALLFEAKDESTVPV